MTRTYIRLLHAAVTDASRHRLTVTAGQQSCRNPREITAVTPEQTMSLSIVNNIDERSL